MVNLKAFNNVTCAPMSPQDDRPAICDLLSKHSKELTLVKELVSIDNPLYNTNRHDDIWLLRFLLSQIQPDKAAVAARNTMQYRHQHNLDALGKLNWIDSTKEVSDISEVPPIFRAYAERVEKGTSYVAQPDGDREIIEYIRLSGVDMGRIASEVSIEEVRAINRIGSEFKFQTLDEVTRRTGRLTKAIRVFDLAGMKVSNFNRKYLKMEGQAAKEIEEFYPQQTDTLFVFNAPSWIQYISKTFKYLFSRRLTKKVNIVTTPRPGDYLPEDSRVFRHVSALHFPSKYGGESDQWPPQGCHGSPISREFSKLSPDAVTPYTDIDVFALGTQ